MTRTNIRGTQIEPLDLTAEVTGVLPTANGGTGASSITGAGIVDTGSAQTISGQKTLVTPKIASVYDTTTNLKAAEFEARDSAVNNVRLSARASTGPAFIEAVGADTNVHLGLASQGAGRFIWFQNSGSMEWLIDGNDTNIGCSVLTKGTGRLQENGVNVLTASSTDNPVTNKTFTGLATTDGIAAVNLPNGITNGNTSAQSQLVVSGTSYYIAGSNLNLPATLKAGMAVGTRFRWRVAMAKTAAGTGAFAIEIRRGTAGTTADTADVSQSIGTQTAAVDSMVVDVEMVVTTTGATGAYYWTIIPVNKAVTATGFGVATGATGQFSGTVSSVAMNTASLKFGLSFKATTGTPTITVPLVRAEALNIS